MKINDIFKDRIGQPIKIEQKEKNSSSAGFSEILRERYGQDRTNKIEFSKHAIERIKLRELNISEEEVRKLEKAVKTLNSKGCRESLVLMDSKAFVVCPKTSKVVTVVDGTNMKENVFTNIDSAILV